MKLLLRKQKNILYSAIALVLLLGFLWLYSEKDGSPTLSGQQKSIKEPDFFINNMQTNSFDSSGKLKETINSSQVLSFAKGNHSTLKQPNIQLFKSGKETWNISADKGVSKKKGALIELKNNVLIDSRSQQYQLVTSALTVHPKRNVAENNQAVTITSPQGITKTTGIKTNFDTGHTLLKQHVKGEYHATP
ncbi:MAG: LPS export ABC transporter protein LptC [Pseudohongiellaceae bacterium]|jgi:LPS export ABC transporter protein LptC